VFTFTPGVPGDSGSAFLDSDGEAVGVLSTLNIAPLAGSNGIADVARAMEYARTVGGLEDLQLVLGTEAFTPSPAGLPLAALATPAGPPVR
jgi:S1-C subfamily serine protease